MRSSKLMNIPHLNFRKDKIDDKRAISRDKKQSLDISKPRFKKNSLEFLNLKNKKKSLEISLPQKFKKNSVELQKPREKKNSLEFQRPRNSNISIRYDRGKKKSVQSLNASYLAHNNKNNLNISREENGSYNNSLLDYKAMGEEIKYTILEMKNNFLMEINDGLDIQKEHVKNEKFDEELTNSEILRRIQKVELQKNNNKSKLKKSFTNEESNPYHREKKDKYYKIKKPSIKNNLIKNEIKDKINVENSDIKKDMKTFIEEKYRIYKKGGQIEDSYNESESDEEGEPDSFLINPETTTFLLYDTLIFITSFYSLVAISYQITEEYFCPKYKTKFKIFIDFFFDILFIFDLIINFFVEIYNEADKLIKNRNKIIKTYLRSWFFFDFLTSIPINIIYYYYCKNYQNQICHTYERNGIVNTLVLLKCLKSIKIFKMPATKKNQLITLLTELASNESSEKVNLTIELLLVIFGLHILSCIHIYIGKYTYPGWIYANNFQDYSVVNLYMISVYYLIQTMTTVGYGDIASDSFVEIVFRIILLAVGIICYSWLISSISNGINKQSYASINFSNECIILENIRREHRDLPYKIYNEIKKHLEYKNFHQQIYDKNLLINSLPYSLKNNLIFSMYKLEIEKFTFFKGISNTNFVSEVLYNFSPLICKKNQILLKENEIIEEVYFVREGGLCLELPINMDRPEESINDYLSKEFNYFAFNFDDKDDLGNIPKMIDSNITNKSLTTILDEKRKNNLFSVIAGKNVTLEKTEPSIFYLKIYDILKNENYGGLYMYHGKRSPFEVKVKSKRVKLYVIKKDDYQNICETYKNFIQRIHKKEKKNLNNIKNILIKTIDKFCHFHGINIKEEYLEYIEKAIKDFNKNTLPDFLKNNSSFAHLFTNEIDEEINKTIKEFSIKLYKISTSKSRYTFKTNTKPNPKPKPKLTPQETIERKMLDNVFKHRKSMSIQFRPKKRSYNFLSKGNLGANIIQSFKPSYRDDFYITKKGPSLKIDEINNKILKKINEEKNRLSEIRKNKLEKNKNEIDEIIGTNEIKETNNINKNDEENEISEIQGINETIKINEIKPILNIKVGSNKNLKEIISINYDDSEKESKKTIKMIYNDKESQGKEPLTLNDLPESLQNVIRNRIKNEDNLKNIYSKFKIEHITIEINNYKNNVNISNNNSLFDNSNLNSTNNMSYVNFNSIKNDIKSFKFGVNKSITNYEKNININYTKSSSFKDININKKNRNNSPKTLKLIKKKTRMKKGNNSVKNKDISSNIKKELTNQSDSRLTLSPFHSSNVFSKMNNTSNLSSMNKFKRISCDNKNIILKFNGELDKKNNLISDDLSSTTAESFQIKRSYKNLNQESGGTYIKNKKLQIKTIKFIKEFENDKQRKKKKGKTLRDHLTNNFDLQNLMKGNKEEENQFKKLENAVRKVKTKMSHILLKKKRITQKNLNQRESLKLNLVSPRSKKKKPPKKQISLNSYFERNHFNNSSNMQINNLSINPDDTLSKLNSSNNEIIKMDFREDNVGKSDKEVKLSKKSVSVTNKK